jgi:hypothetical protein
MGASKEQAGIRLRREVEQFLAQKGGSSFDGIALLKKIRPLASASLREEVDAIMFDAGRCDVDNIKKVSKAWLQEGIDAKVVK